MDLPVNTKIGKGIVRDQEILPLDERISSSRRDHPVVLTIKRVISIKRKEEENKKEDMFSI